VHGAVSRQNHGDVMRYTMKAHKHAVAWLYLVGVNLREQRRTGTIEPFKHDRRVMRLRVRHLSVNARAVWDNARLVIECRGET
jgi:hypothetical protein